MKLDFFMGYTGYYLLGQYLRDALLTKTARTVLYVLGISGVAITVICSSMVSIGVDAATDLFYSYFRINVFLAALAIFVAFHNLKRHKNLSKRMTSLIAECSNCCFGIYLIHDLIIIALKNLGILPSTFNAMLSVPIFALCIFLVCLALVFFMRRIPLIGKYIT